MIEYEWISDNLTAVFLEGKRVGKIQQIYGKYRYIPKSSKAIGEPFDTLEECKKSLEEE